MMPLVLFGIFAWSVGICVDGLPPPVRVLKGGEPIAGQAYAKQEELGVYDRGPINLPTEVRKSAVQRFDELFFQHGGGVDRAAMDRFNDARRGARRPSHFASDRRVQVDSPRSLAFYPSRSRRAFEALDRPRSRR